MTCTLASIASYLSTSLVGFKDDLSWIRAHLDNLEHRSEYYLPKMFDAQIQIVEGTDRIAAEVMK
jgi:hypothetical protein